MLGLKPAPQAEAQDQHVGRSHRVGGVSAHCLQCPGAATCQELSLSLVEPGDIQEPKPSAHQGQAIKESPPPWAAATNTNAKMAPAGCWEAKRA